MKSFNPCCIYLRAVSVLNVIIVQQVTTVIIFTYIIPFAGLSSYTATGDMWHPCHVAMSLRVDILRNSHIDRFLRIDRLSVWIRFNNFMIERKHVVFYCVHCYPFVIAVLQYNSCWKGNLCLAKRKWFVKLQQRKPMHTGQGFFARFWSQLNKDIGD